MYGTVFCDLVSHSTHARRVLQVAAVQDRPRSVFWFRFLADPGVSPACFSVRGVFLHGWSMLISEFRCWRQKSRGCALAANSCPLDVVEVGAGDFCCHVSEKKMQHSLSGSESVSQNSVLRKNLSQLRQCVFVCVCVCVCWGRYFCLFDGGN